MVGHIGRSRLLSRESAFGGEMVAVTICASFDLNVLAVGEGASCLSRTTRSRGW